MGRTSLARAPVLDTECNRSFTSFRMTSHCSVDRFFLLNTSHTQIPAAIKAIEALDVCIGRAVAAQRAAGGEVLITSDHGNAEMMFDPATGQPHTAHTLLPVPFVYVGRPATMKTGGALQDVAPTLLAMMGVAQPPAMTGRSLIEFAARP